MDLCWVTQDLLLWHRDALVGVFRWVKSDQVGAGSRVVKSQDSWTPGHCQPKGDRGQHSGGGASSSLPFKVSEQKLTLLLRKVSSSRAWVS